MLISTGSYKAFNYSTPLTVWCFISKIVGLCTAVCPLALSVGPFVCGFGVQHFRGCWMRAERTRFHYYDPFVNFVVVVVDVDVPFISSTVYYNTILRYMLI